MNLRFIAVVLGLGVIVADATAQSLPPALRTTAAVTDADRGTIKQFVATQVAKLSSNEPQQQAEGRDALVGAIDASASPSYSDAYGTALAEALTPLATSEQVRVALNAAIVIGRVAEKSPSLALKPAVAKFVTHPSPAVALWAVKAHAPLILAQLRADPVGAAKDPIVTGLVPAVRNRLSGPIAQETYEALNLSYVTQRANLTEPMVKAVIGPIQDLLAARIAVYQNGTPETPVADTRGTGFLVDELVWRSQTPEQRVRTAQLVADLLAAGAARSASFERDRGRKAEVVRMLTLVASAVQVIGQAGNKPALVEAAAPVSRLDASTDSAAIQSACNALIASIVTEVQGVKKPTMQVGAVTAPAATTAAAQ